MVKKHHFTGRGQVADIAPEVPLCSFCIGGLFQRYCFGSARIKVFRDSFDGAAFAPPLFICFGAFSVFLGLPLPSSLFLLSHIDNCGKKHGFTPCLLMLQGNKNRAGLSGFAIAFALPS